jgi:hypothetical protein
MASYLCAYAFAKLTDHELGGVALTPPATWYVGLCLAPAAKDGLLHDANGSVAEVSGGGYARVAVANNATNFPNAISSWKTNGTAITFPQPSGTWGLVVSAFLADAPTGGNVWRHWDLVTPCNLVNGSFAPSFPAGTLYLARS